MHDRSFLPFSFFAAVCFAATAAEHAVFLAVSAPAADCAAWCFRLFGTAFLWLPVALCKRENANCRSAALMSLAAQASACVLAVLPCFLRGRSASEDAGTYAFVFMFCALSDLLSMKALLKLDGDGIARRCAAAVLCFALAFNALLLSLFLRRQPVSEAFIFIPVFTYCVVWPADMTLCAWSAAGRRRPVTADQDCRGCFDKHSS